MRRETNWGMLIAPQAGVVPLMLGMPGIGKTEGAMALARLLGRPFHSLILSQCMPEDLGGIPVVVEENGNKVVRKIPMADLVSTGFLCLDEFTNTQRSMQAPALEIVRNANTQGRFVVALGNGDDSAVNGAGVAPTMMNRLCLLEADQEDMVNGFMRALANDKADAANLVFEDQEIPILRDGWQSGRAAWSGMVFGFLQQHAEFKARFVEDENTAWPSPRSWHNALHLLAAGDSVEASEHTMTKMVVGCVGKAAGEGLMAYVREMRLVPPEDVLADRHKFSLPKAGDKALAICRSVVNHVRRIGDGPTSEMLRDFVCNVFRQKAELGILLYCMYTDIWTNVVSKTGWRRPERRDVELVEIEKVLSDSATR